MTQAGGPRDVLLAEPRGFCAGVVRAIWRKVKVDGHAEKVLAALAGL